MITDFAKLSNTNNSSNDPVNNSSQATHYVDEYLPPVDSTSYMDTQTATSPSVTTSPATSTDEIAQSLEDQNIFVLLGVEDGSDEQKEAFLDELQQVIWEDFLENDVELLLTEQEMTDLRAILDKPTAEEAQKQEETVVFLEKLIPDLEEIMLEKALELKEDMVRERLLGLREFFSDDTQKLARLNEVETLMNQNKWNDAAKAMNSLK